MAEGSILVGTDFSDGAALALEAARGLANELHYRVQVAHVIERAAHEDLAARPAVTEWLERVGVSRADVVLRTGTPWVELVRFAVEHEPSMIVVGSHGTSGFQPVALGTTAARLGVHSPYPVLVVTAGANGRVGERRLAADRR